MRRINGLPWGILTALVSAAAMVLTLGCAGTEQPANLLLITLDTTGAGYDPQCYPRLFM